MTSTVLVIIDIQRDYFPGGRHPLVGADEAAAVARRVLARHREQGGRVIHVQHLSPAGSGFLERGTEGAEIAEAVTPLASETLVVKEHPNSFLDTVLADELGPADQAELLVCGMMTSMCVDATVRAASDLGYRVTVVADACAAPDLEFGGRRVDGATVSTAFLAALSGAYARVLFADDLN